MFAMGHLLKPSDYWLSEEGLPSVAQRRKRQLRVNLVNRSTSRGSDMSAFSQGKEPYVVYKGSL